MRYLDYFSDVLKGFTPINKPMVLQRIIMNGMPDVAADEEDEFDEDEDEKLSPGDGRQGATVHGRRVLCTPYI